MRMRSTLILPGVAALGLSAALAWQDAPAPSASLQVTRAVACLEIRDREPVSIDSVFSNQTPRIYCHTQIEGAAEPVEIQHVWIHNGEEKAAVKLMVRGSPWRTYSSKTMLPEWTGAWKVEIRDAAGSVLKSVEFSVTEKEGAEGS